MDDSRTDHGLPSISINIFNLINMSDSSSSDDTVLYPYDPEQLEGCGKNIFAYVDPELTTGLAISIFARDIPAIKLHLENGKNPNTPDNKGHTSLHIATITNDIKVFQCLLESEQVFLDHRNHYGWTCLYMSLKYNCSDEFVLYLIEAGCSVTIPSNEDVTPLHLAVKRSGTRVVEKLIEKGAEVNAIDFDGFTPLHEAIYPGNPEVIHMLLYHGADVTIDTDGRRIMPLALAILQHHSRSVIEEMIMFTSDLNGICRFDSRTVLWHAVNTGDCQLVKLLVDNGADVNITFLGPNMSALLVGEMYPTHCNEQSLLDLAIQKSTPEIFNYLWKKIDKKKFIKNRCCFFDKMIQGCAFSNEDWLGAFYKVLHSSVGSHLAHKCCPFIYLLPEVLRMRDISKGETVKLLYAILAQSPMLTYFDILSFYRIHGFDEIFEVFANVNQPLNIQYFRKSKFDDVLLHFVMYPYRYMPFNKPSTTLNSMETKLYKYFSREVSLNRDLLYKYNLSRQYWRCPKLSELARDSIRLAIGKRHAEKGQTGPFDYVNDVKTLGLPRKIQDILVFKEALYEDCD